MPSDYIQIDITRERLDIRVNDLLNGLEIDIDRSPIADDDDPGRGTTRISPKVTDNCTQRTCGVCTGGNTCTCHGCLPGFDLDLRGGGLEGW
jgi:hypothetical protein